MSDIDEAKRLVLDQYEKEYAELGLLIGRLRRDLGITKQEKLNFDAGSRDEQNSGHTGTNLQQLIKPGDLFGVTQIEGVKQLLQLNKQPMSLQDIAAGLYRGRATDALIQGPALRNLSSVLSRSDEFISVAKGRWGLLEWYPTRAKRTRKPRDGQNIDDARGVEDASGSESEPTAEV